mmetsp:Transcript_57983/g.170193  ORF Transcript_57983/g.170193 Transcript_57983/m.170193 type:complete len:359 (+) Transcript_57983:1237-2313(+)
MQPQHLRQRLQHGQQRLEHRRRHLLVLPRDHGLLPEGVAPTVVHDLLDEVAPVRRHEQDEADRLRRERRPVAAGAAQEHLDRHAAAVREGVHGVEPALGLLVEFRGRGRLCHLLALLALDFPLSLRLPLGLGLGLLLGLGLPLGLRLPFRHGALDHREAPRVELLVGVDPLLLPAPEGAGEAPEVLLVADDEEDQRLQGLALELAVEDLLLLERLPGLAHVYVRLGGGHLQALRLELVRLLAHAAELLVLGALDDGGDRVGRLGRPSELLHAPVQDAHDEVDGALVGEKVLALPVRLVARRGHRVRRVRHQRAEVAHQLAAGLRHAGVLLVLLEGLHDHAEVPGVLLHGLAHLRLVLH